MLWVLFAVLAAVAQGQIDSSTYKWYTVNTFRLQRGFTFSCYGVDADCEVYYAPPGNGTSGDSLVSIGSVRKYTSHNLLYLARYQLGGGFFSDNPVGVYYAEDDGTQVYLPSATEAGTKFHIPVSSKTSQKKHECGIFALWLPAEVTITINGVVTSLSIDPFRSSKFDIDLSGSSVTQAVTMINSDYPIIVSCLGRVTVQSISSEPLLYVAPRNEIVSVAISDCSTNELVTDFSKLNVTSASYETGSACQLTRYDSDEIQVFKAKSSDCYFFVEPLDNVCISMLAISAQSRTPNAVGLPGSKFSTRFVTRAKVSNVGLVSFSETTCTGSPSTSLSLNWLPQPLSGKVSFAAWPPSSQFSKVKCDDPILVIFNPPYPEPPTEPPTDPPTEPPTEAPTHVTPEISTSVPSSSNARSLVSYTSWFAFFEFYLFSSSLV